MNTIIGTAKPFIRSSAISGICAERSLGALSGIVVALSLAFLAGCGGSGSDASVAPNATATSTARVVEVSRKERETPAALASTQAVSNPSAATFTGFLGHGTNHSPGGFLTHTVQSMFPINNAGVVAINKVISEYTNPNPDPALRDGFLLTTDGNTYENVTAGGVGQLLHYGYSINDAKRLTYQRGPVNSGTPQAYQFFSREAPYTTLSTYSDACTCYAFNLYTNAAGKGVALVSASDTNQPSVVRFDGHDGQDGTQTLLIPANYLSGTRKTKILADGTIYVGLLNYDSQPQAHEIWRFASAETQIHTVAYSLAAAAAQLIAWDVNEAGALVVSELGVTGSVLKTIAPGGSPVVVSGTETDAYGLYLSVFINQSGMLAAVTAYQSGPNIGLQELLYVPPGGSPVRVLATGDVMNGGVVGNIATSSEMNESGQLTLLMQLDLSPEPNPTRSLASIVTPLFPVISAITPASGPVGSAVVISGKNLGTASAVSFNGTSASLTVDSATQITATVPTGATNGPVTVTTPAGVGTSTTAFTVTTGFAPTLTSFSPAIGGVGTSVTIKGSIFNVAGLMVRFNGTPASYRLKGASQITAIVPAGATSGPISVTTPGGTATSASDFTVVPAPTIADFSPGAGPAGTMVTINGTGFDDASAVTFGGSKASVTLLSPTSISAVVPKGAKVGFRFIVVSTLGGSATSALPFDVTK